LAFIFKNRDAKLKATLKTDEGKAQAIHEYVTEYHAWNEIDLDGKWMIVDATGSFR